MKNTFIALFLMMTVFPAFAQRHRFPSQCEVAAIDRYNRIIATFRAPTNGNGRCNQGIRICNMEVRRRGWYDARCVPMRNRW